MIFHPTHLSDAFSLYTIYFLRACVEHAILLRLFISTFLSLFYLSEPWKTNIQNLNSWLQPSTQALHHASILYLAHFVFSYSPRLFRAPPVLLTYSTLKPQLSAYLPWWLSLRNTSTSSQCTVLHPSGCHYSGFSFSLRHKNLALTCICCQDPPLAHILKVMYHYPQMILWLCQQQSIILWYQLL